MSHFWGLWDVGDEMGLLDEDGEGTSREGRFVVRGSFVGFAV